MTHLMEYVPDQLPESEVEAFRERAQARFKWREDLVARAVDAFLRGYAEADRSWRARRAA